MQTLTEKDVPSVQSGLVISYFGNSVAVEARDGQVFQCHLKRNQALPVVGDRVEWRLEQGNTGTITTILPRSTLLARGDGHGNLKPLAANVDVILIVMAPPPIFSEYLIDRYAVAAELLQIKPVLILNKMDLLNEISQPQSMMRLSPYQKIPYPVLLTSIYDAQSMQAVNAFLKDKTAVLVGPSGVGKSSIIAALGNADSIRVGDVTAKGAGKHTTTATRLYHLPNGGQLIDSPGVREFNLWPVSAHDILKSFKEFERYSHHCKFRDCQHMAEPGCSVKEAIKQGEISPSRFESYQAIMKEAKRHD